jgi:hypothetical protein
MSTSCRVTFCRRFPLLTGQPEAEDLRPVGVVHRLGLVMHGGDRCLQLIRAGGALAERGGHQCGASSILARSERDQAYPVPCGARGPSRVGEQQEREQAGHPRLVRQQTAQSAAETDGLTGERGHGDRVTIGRGVTLAISRSGPGISTPVNVDVAPSA